MFSQFSTTVHIDQWGVIDIFNSLLSLSLLLALAINYLYLNYSNNIPIGCLLDSASDSDSKSNELKMSNSAYFVRSTPPRAFSIFI